MWRLPSAVIDRTWQGRGGDGWDVTRGEGLVGVKMELLNRSEPLLTEKKLIFRRASALTW